MAYNPMSRDQYMNTYSDIINQQYGKAQNQITEQQQQLKPMYQQQRNATDVQAHQNSRRLSELMAQRGMGRTGTMMTGMAGVQNQRMGQLADINRDQSFANTQMGNRLAELEQGRAADLSRAALGYEDYGFRAEQLKQNLASLMGSYGGQQTLAAKQTAMQNALAEAGLTGMYNGQQTLAGRQFDSDQAYRNQQTEWQRQQAMMNLLMNYYNNSTSGWQMPSSVKPSDYLEQLFKSAGYR